MIDTSKITKALVRQLKNDAALVEMGFTITRSEYINTDPSDVPWAGVYRVTTTYSPGTLGHHAASWDGTVEIKVVVQAASTSGDGAQAEVDLCRYEEAVITAIWSDPTIGNTVDMLTGLAVDYTFVDTGEDNEALYFPNAVITVTAEVTAG